jgi:hypothetical protein
VFGAVLIELVAMACVLPASVTFCKAIKMEYSTDGVTEHRVNGVAVNRTIHLYLMAESRENLHIEMREAAAPAILATLEACLPHATVAPFTPDARAKYLTDPQMLRRAPSAPADGGTYRERPTRKRADAPTPPKASCALAAVLCLAGVAAAPWIADFVWRSPERSGERPGDVSKVPSPAAAAPASPTRGASPST